MVNFIILSTLLVNTTKYKAYSEQSLYKKKSFLSDLRATARSTHNSTARSTHNSIYLPTYPYAYLLYYLKNKVRKPSFSLVSINIPY